MLRLCVCGNRIWVLLDLKQSWCWLMKRYQAFASLSIYFYLAIKLFLCLSYKYFKCFGSVGWKNRCKDSIWDIPLKFSTSTERRILVSSVWFTGYPTREHNQIFTISIWNQVYLENRNVACETEIME